MITMHHTTNASGACKRPAPSSSSAEDLDCFICSICMEVLKEPTITHCGHTYCQGCILATIQTISRCPKCGTHLTTEKLCPNFALNNAIIVRARNDHRAIQAVVFESSCPKTACSSSSSPPTDIVKVLSSTNYSNLKAKDLDRLLHVLKRQREIVASDDEEYKRKLMQEFLSQLLQVKNSSFEQLNREISMINKDMLVLRSCYVGGPEAGLASTSKDSKVVEVSDCSGFNTQALRNVEMEQKSLASRKKRMHSHFDELSQLYCEQSDMKVSNKFGQTLSDITQYHGLKPLVTLSYNADKLSNSTIVSSIEFDKDNEFFAIAGVSKKIKIFEYINVIRFAQEDIHCPNTELSCNADRTSCVAWSNYYKYNLASSDNDGCVSLWDVASGTKVRSLIEHEKRVWCVDWSNGDPKLLASGSDDSKVKLWSTNSEKSIANLESKFNVCSVKFCPESTFVIAFGTSDHFVHYYDFRNPRVPLCVLCGHKSAVSYVKFVSKDELVSASTDNNLKLWNLDESTSCVRTFQGHTNEKSFVGLATDGNYIACGSENNSVYLYHKFLSKPLFSFKFEHYRGSMIEQPKPDESPRFVSAVAWRKGSPVVVAANSQGAIKILELM